MSILATYKPALAASDYSTDTHISTQVRAFLKLAEGSGKPMEKLPIQEARLALETAQSSIETDMSGVQIVEKTIEVDGHGILLHVIRPDSAPDRLPVFVFIHGGGWVLGDFPTHKRLVRDLVIASGMACVFVNYSRTPEAIFPQALNEIYGTVMWLANHGLTLNLDCTRLALAGNSAGGSMALATAMMAKDKGGPPIACLLLQWPTVDANFTRVSYQKYGEGRSLTTAMMKWMYGMYLPKMEQHNDIYALPMQATIQQLIGLPPTLIQVAENDVLRDEAETFGRMLNAADVPVTTVRYNGMIHDFGMLNALAHLSETSAAMEQGGQMLKKYLSLDPIPSSDSRIKKKTKPPEKPVSMTKKADDKTLAKWADDGGNPAKVQVSHPTVL